MSNMPSSTAPLHEFWLLDTAGRMLGHDTLADAITPQPFTPHSPPGLSLQAEAPLPRKAGDSPVRGAFHKQLSLPFPFPDVTLTQAWQGLVTIRSLEGHQGWLELDQEKKTFHFTDTDADVRERFLPLSRQAFAGLSLLHDRERAEIRAVTGQVLGPASLLLPMPHGLSLGTASISLAGNLAELERISQLPPGQDDILTLQRDANPAHAFSFIIRPLG